MQIPIKKCQKIQSIRILGNKIAPDPNKIYRFEQ